MENNLEQGTTIPVPTEVAGKFNWGAFFFTWIWGICNKTYITLIMLAAGLFAIIPFVGAFIPLAIAIWFGVKGNEWAWQNKEWESIEAFQSHQKKWAMWAGIVFAVSIVFSLLLGILVVILAMASSYAG